MERRITVVCAPIGFGKTVAVREVLDLLRAEVEWFEVEASGVSAAEVFDGLHSSTAVRVIDRADLLSEDAIAELVFHIERSNAKWILIMRSLDGWPIGRWIDAGLCEFPIATSTLRFTSEEAFEFLRASSDGQALKAVRDIYGLMLLAEGWPIVLGLAAAAMRNGLAEPLNATRAVIERYVQDEIFVRLGDQEWSLLVQSVCVGYLRFDWIEKLQGTGTLSEGTVRSLLARAPWFEISEARWRLPKLVRRLVQRRAFHDHAKYRQGLEVAGQINEDGGRVFAAIRAYLTAGDLDSVERLIRRDGAACGFSLDGAILDTALSKRASDDARPLILALRGAYEVRRQHFESSLTAFERALDLAGEADRPLVAVPYAQALLMMRRPNDALALLKKLPSSGLESHKIHYWATRAWAELCTGDAVAAEDSHQKVRVLLPNAVKSTSLCWSLVYLADVALFLGRSEEADGYNAQALQLARAFSLSALEARVLYYGYPRRRDLLEDYSTNPSMLECALALAVDSHDRLLESRVLSALIDVWLRRGGDAEVAYFQAELKAIAPPLPSEMDWISSRGRAMCHAWEGGFQEAAYSARRSLSNFPVPDWQVLRMAELALYSSQFDVPAVTVLASEIAERVDAVSMPGRRAQTLAVLGAALASIGAPHMDCFRRAQAEAALVPGQRAGIFVRAFLGFAQAMRRSEPLTEVDRDALLTNGLGGWSRVLAAMKPATATTVRLSPKQLEVLKRIRRGLTGTAIASELNMAPGTVKKHIDRICARLGAKGRRAAVAMADRYGLFEEQT
jgi:ATP/maltotriose-dependent transcriptional regulator MalT